MENLKDIKVAILATNGFEDSELAEPKKALEEAGATVHIISEEAGEIKSWNKGDWGKAYKVDKTLDEVDHSEYRSLMLPGGVINPDKLRRNKKAVQFVRSFFENHKPVSAICHAPQLLIEAEVVENRKMTSFNQSRKILLMPVQTGLMKKLWLMPDW